MAFNTGKETTENSGRIVRYIGVAPCYVLAVNPSQEKANELLGYEAPVAPYVTEVEVNGKKVPNVRIDFIVKTDKDVCGVETVGKLTFFIQKTYKEGSASGKYQIIDKYGRTAWGTKEDITAKAIPMYTNGPANISEGYRLAFTGEEDLTNFLINFLNIPNVMKWNAKLGKFDGMVDNPEDSEARLDNIEDYFKSKFAELEKILSYQPNNKIKLLFGVRTTEKDGQTRTYQTIYSRVTLSNRITNYDKLLKEIQDRKSRGGLADTAFTLTNKEGKEYIPNFQEYNVEATDFSAAPNTPADDPFGDTPAVSNGVGSEDDPFAV